MKEKIAKNSFVIKLLLDLIMLVLLTLMYSKMAISMEFHEIGGLFLFFLILLHLIINYRWVIGVTKKLFSKTLPIKTRIGYLVNLLLFVLFILVCISGIFISKILFQINMGMIWRTVHCTSAAFALILIGIHIGFHMKMFFSFMKKKIKVPMSAGKIIGIICLILVAFFGVYNIAITSFGQWISMPFTMSSMSHLEKMPDDGAKPDFQKNR